MTRKTTQLDKPAAKLSRADKVTKNRLALLHAGAEIVGEKGYEDASIAHITERAGLGHGTFYKHFPSRQAMFDELLPSVGRELIDEVREIVRGAENVLDMEERGFRGFFDFLVKHPGFYRVLNEAEVAAPKAFDVHIKTLARHYVRALKRSQQRGGLKDFAELDFEVIAFTLMAARFYLYLRFSKAGGKAKRVPDAVVKAYMRFVAYGLVGRP
jgi:AcrR family transcriptional regulator